MNFAHPDQVCTPKCRNHCSHPRTPPALGGVGGSVHSRCAAHTQSAATPCGASPQMAGGQFGEATNG